MLSKSIYLKNYKSKKFNKDIKKKLALMLKNNSELFNSMRPTYKDSFNLRNIKKKNGKNDIRIIGIGGSILGSQAIYNFLKNKIKKNFILLTILTLLKKLMIQKLQI